MLRPSRQENIMCQNCIDTVPTWQDDEQDAPEPTLDEFLRNLEFQAGY